MILKKMIDRFPKQVQSSARPLQNTNFFDDTTTLYSFASIIAPVVFEFKLRVFITTFPNLRRHLRREVRNVPDHKSSHHLHSPSGRRRGRISKRRSGTRFTLVLPSILFSLRRTCFFCIILPQGLSHFPPCCESRHNVITICGRVFLQKSPLLFIMDGVHNWLCYCRFRVFITASIVFLLGRNKLPIHFVPWMMIRSPATTEQNIYKVTRTKWATVYHPQMIMGSSSAWTHLDLYRHPHIPFHPE